MVELYLHYPIWSSALLSTGATLPFNPKVAFKDVGVQYMKLDQRQYLPTSRPGHHLTPTMCVTVI
jgi:hypothetical protein